jgi:predicted nucleic acid-binding protein
MIVLDTNIISEMLRQAPNGRVLAWLDAQPASELYLCTPVLAELYYGISRLIQSARKRGLMSSYRQVVDESFTGRILAFDAGAAEDYGELMAKLAAQGTPMSLIDGMIAAVARTNGATLATRNTAHFSRADIPLIDPFGAG